MRESSRDFGVRQRQWSGRCGSNMRRNAAIAAAEAAASYIMSSDTTQVTNNIRNRFVAAPAASGAAGVTYHNSIGVSITSREAMMQRLIRRRPSSKMPSPIVVIVIILVIVIVFAMMGGDSTTRVTTKKTNNLPQHSLRALHSKQNSHQTVVAPSTETAKSSHIDFIPSAEEEEEEEGISTVVDVDESSIAEEETDGRTMMMIENRHPEEYEESVVVPADAKITTITTDQQQQHHHAIPSILIFTYHTNLLTALESDLGDEEDVALAHNVRSIISLHTNDSSTTTTTTTVRFLTDEDCIDSIRMALGHDTNLTTYFTTEKHGMYKADICRGAALYESGGLYFDVDIEARMSMFHVLHTQTKFVTALVHKDSNHHGMFFQAFIGSTPQHPILKRYLELFVLYYEGKVDVSGPLGVYFLRMAYNDVVGDKGEVMTPYIPDDNTIDLWQEIRYQPDLFPDVTRKHWGSRRACQMVVVAPPMTTTAIGRKKRMVPLFSHANGSRMCGGKDTITKKVKD